VTETCNEGDFSVTIIHQNEILFKKKENATKFFFTGFLLELSLCLLTATLLIKQ